MATWPQPDSCLLGSPLGLICLSLLIPVAGASSCPSTTLTRAPPCSGGPSRPMPQSVATRVGWPGGPHRADDGPWAPGACLCSWKPLRLQPGPQPGGPHRPSGGAGGHQCQLLLCPGHRGGRRHPSQGVCAPHGQGEGPPACPGPWVPPGEGLPAPGWDVTGLGEGRGGTWAPGVQPVLGLTPAFVPPVRHALEPWTPGE